jgi:uncharacterized protein (DUF1330 family)
MAKGYWIAHVTVNDPANYPKYKDRVGPIVKAYNGRFLTRGGRFESPEGSPHQRHVIVEFDSFEKAKACYFSPEYQAAVKLRLAYATSNLYLVEGSD